MQKGFALASLARVGTAGVLPVPPGDRHDLSPPNLEATLATARAEAKTLRSHGHVVQAETIERICALVEVAASDYLDWLSEADARLRSNRCDDFLKARRKAWEEDGLAEKRGRGWFYRRVAIERRRLPSIERADEQGREAARRFREKSQDGET